MGAGGSTGVGRGVGWVVGVGDGEGVSTGTGGIELRLIVGVEMGVVIGGVYELFVVLGDGVAGGTVDVDAPLTLLPDLLVFYVIGVVEDGGEDGG